MPVFYLAFLHLGVADAFSAHPTAAYHMDEQYSMPGATVWKAVADILTQGISNIEPSARIAALVGVVLGVILEFWRILSRNRFPLSPVGIGLGFIIQFHTCLSMFLGAFLFWVIAKCFPKSESKVNEVVVQNQEPISAGLVAGGALMGIVVTVAAVWLPKAGH